MSRLAAVLLLLPLPAFACSLREGYLPPSNYELVRDAAAIVLARSVAFREGNDRDEGSVVEMKVVRSIRGTFDGQTLSVHGYDDFEGASEPEDFTRPRPGAFRGACNAYDYRADHLYVLFLARHKGEWVVDGPPFCRINEEVPAEDAPWVRAVEHYARISALGDYEEEKTALRELRQEVLARPGDPAYPVGLVVDVDTHFASPHPTKSFADLTAMLEKAEAPRARAAAVWAIVGSEHEERGAFVRNLVERQAGLRLYPGPVCDHAIRSGDETLFEKLHAAWRDAPEERKWEILRAVLATGRAERSETILEMLRQASDEEARPLADWFVRYPSSAALAEVRRRIGGDHAKNWQLTFAAAAMGDESVIDWAETATGGSRDERWIPIYAIARSPLERADRLAERIVEGEDDEALVILVQGYAESPSPTRWDRLARVAARKDRSAEVREWLRHTLQSMAARGDGVAAAMLADLDD